MIDDQRAGQPAEQSLVLGDMAAVHLEHHVPAERRHARRHGFQNLQRQRRACQHEEPDAANAEPGQPLELGVGHALVDHRDAARARSDRRHGLERAAVVLAVGRRLHHHRALDAEPGAHLEVIRHRCVGRQNSGGRRFRKAVIVNVHMRVAGAGGRLEFRQQFALGRRHADFRSLAVREDRYSPPARAFEAADRFRQ